MSKTLKLLTLCALLVGCAPLSIYYRPGVSVAQLQTDTTNCQVQALRDAPVANQIRRAPPVYYPGERVCNSEGKCLTRPGYWVDGQIYTVDVNEGLRARVETQCMAQKGYIPASIPPCSQEIANSFPPAATTTLPQLTPNSCVIRNRSGSWQIVNPG